MHISLYFFFDLCLLYFFIFLNPQNSKSKNTDKQIETETLKKKKLTSRQRKALTKIVEKKQKNQKVIIIQYL